MAIRDKGAQPTEARPWVQAAAWMLLCGVLPLLAGCSWVPDTINPVDWWHNMEGGEIAKERPPPPGSNQPYPNLATIPPRPAAPDQKTLEAITQGLVADRAHAEYLAAATPLPDPSSPSASPGLFGQGTMPPPPPPPPPGSTVASATMPAAAGPSAAAPPQVSAPTGPPPAPSPAPRSAVQSAPLAPLAPATPAPSASGPSASGPSASAPSASAPPPSASAAPASAAPASPAPPPAGAPAQVAAGGIAPPAAESRMAAASTPPSAAAASQEAAAAAPMPAAPPAPPALTGPGAPATQPAMVASASPPAPSPRPANAVTVEFVPGSAQLPPGAADVLKSVAAKRGAALVAVTGYGEASSDDPAVQSAALSLGLSRAQAVANVLTGDGVPQADVRVGAEAAGRGASVRLVQ